MPVTGGFPRTAVNAESGVKSPLSGLMSSACVLVSIYKLARAFYWIAKATLSAIIITAVWQIVIPAKVFYKYWQTSFADFIASMFFFWVTIFASVEIRIAAGVGFSLVYMLLRIAFAGVTYVTADNLSSSYPFHKSGKVQAVVPEGTQIFKLDKSLLLPNSNPVKKNILNTVYTYTSGAPIASVFEKDRLWNATGEKGVRTLRAKAGLDPREERPVLRAVVLDFANVARIDTTGVQAVVYLKADLRRYAGEGSEVRFLGLNEGV